MPDDKLLDLTTPPDFDNAKEFREKSWALSVANHTLAMDNHDGIVGIKATCAARLPICMARFDRISQVALGGNIAAAEVHGERVGEKAGVEEGVGVIEKKIGHVVVTGVTGIGGKFTPYLIAGLTALLGASTLWGHIERNRIGDDAKSTAKAAVTTAVAAVVDRVQHGNVLESDNAEILTLLRRLAARAQEPTPPLPLMEPRAPSKVEPMVTMPRPDNSKE